MTVPFSIEWVPQRGTMSICKYCHLKSPRRVQGLSSRISKRMNSIEFQAANRSVATKRSPSSPGVGSQNVIVCIQRHGQRSALD